MLQQNQKKLQLELNQKKLQLELDTLLGGTQQTPTNNNHQIDTQPWHKSAEELVRKQYCLLLRFFMQKLS